MAFKGICLFLLIGSVLLTSGCVSVGQVSSTPVAPANTNTQTSMVTSYFVSFTIERGSGGDILITNTGGAGVGSLKAVKISFTDNTGATVGPDTCFNLIPDGVSGSLDGIGSSASIAKNSAASPSHVIVTGTFKDNSEQVLTVADV